MAETRPCFKNQYAQLVHQYSNYILTLALGLIVFIYLGDKTQTKTQLDLNTKTIQDHSMALENVKTWRDEKVVPVMTATREQLQQLERESQLRASQLEQTVMLVRDIKTVLDQLAVKQIELRESTIRIEEQLGLGRNPLSLKRR